MRRAAVLCAVAIAGIAQAGPSISLNTSSTLTLAITQQADIPIQLAAGPEGSTTISVNQTGAKSTVVGDDTWRNTTYINNTGSTDYRIRLNHVSATNIAACGDCRLRFSQGGTNVVQLRIVDGAVTVSQGALQSIPASGSFGSVWHLWSRGDIVGAPQGQVTSWKYTLEIVPTASTSPSVVYWNMTMDFTAP